MDRRFVVKSKRLATNNGNRVTRFELLQDRRVLAPLPVDIVFLVDESASDIQVDNSPQQWLRERLFTPSGGGPSFFDSTLASSLAELGIADADVKYGLVGFGQGTNPPLHAHSQIVNGGGADPLFGTASQFDAALNNLVTNGGEEDGWDALEHVVSEYKFRPNAIPLVVLVQNQEGRVNLNTTLTREGVLAALESKGIVLTTMVVGLSPSGLPNDVFDLTPYDPTSTFRILGVEADRRGRKAEEKGTGVIFLFF